MQVTFYQFSKKLNSTAVPSWTSDSAAYDVTLKEPSSALAPVISLVWPGSGSPVHFNYAYIPAFSRYYFVSNWNYADRQWTAEMSVDVLATWWKYIRNETKYVLRAAPHSHGVEQANYINDGIYPATLDHGALIGKNSYPFSYTEGSGYYVVGVMGTGASKTYGGVAYYQISSSSAKQLIAAVYQKAITEFNPHSITDYGEAILTFGENLVKSLMNPMQFIVSVMWMPISFTTGASEEIIVGVYHTGVYGTPITDPVQMVYQEITIPQHPDYSISKKWMLTEPYSNYTLLCEPFGMMPVDSQDLLDYTKIWLRFKIDAISGIGTLKVVVGDDDNHGAGGMPISLRTAQMGVQMSLSGVMANNAGALMDIGGAVTQIASEDYIGASASILNAGQNLIPQARSSGTNSGFGGYDPDGQIYLILRYYKVIDSYSAEKGVPVCKDAQLKNYDGYILCEEGDVHAPATQAELAQIKAFLEGGFFNE